MLFKTRLTAILVIAAFASISSCSKKGGSDTPSTPAPVANFSYSGAGVAPATVSFTNSSTNASSYTWDFGDNGTSTSSSPTHTYTRGGVFTVKLTATGSGGTASTTKTVNVTAPTSLKVTNVKVTALALTKPSGGGWDPSSGPDVYYKIGDASGATLYTSGYFDNVTTSSLPLTWPLSPAFQFPNLTSQYQIVFWDRDAPLADEQMDGYTFTIPSFVAAGYPSMVTLQVPNNTLKVELSLQWQ